MRTAALARSLAIACGLVACAAEPPPPVKPPAAPAAAEAPPPETEAEIGGLNQEAVERRFATLSGPIGDCVQTGAKRVRELGGNLGVSLRVDRQGRARWAYLATSTLGDQETERCILDLVLQAEWPRPKSGEGLASHAFEIEPGSPPVVWEEKRIRRGLRISAKAFAKCTKGRRGFVATAYVRPDGRVATAGVAPPDAESDEVVDCLAKVIRTLRFGSPGRRAAKVTFDVK